MKMLLLDWCTETNELQEQQQVLHRLVLPRVTCMSAYIAGDIHSRVFGIAHTLKAL